MRERQARFQAARRTPEARAERARSRLEHRGLDRGAALALARSRFDAAFTERLYPKLDVGGTRVLGYEGDFKAFVERPDGERLVVDQQGAVPLRSDVGSGQKAPVDLTLEAAGASFEPRNPVVPVSISSEGAVTLPEQGVGFAVADTGEVSLGQVGEDRLFAENVLPDTDMILSPSALGTRVAFQVRSAQAPEQATLRFDLPPGAQLRRATGPTAEVGLGPLQMIYIVRGEKVLATLMPPVAWDAEGAPVEVSYELAGDEVVVTFPHRDKDLLYPLLVDPDLIAQFGYGYLPWTTWQSYSYPAGKFALARNYALVIGNSTGYFAGDYMGQWYRTWGSGWMIKTATFSGMSHTGNYGMCLQAGLWFDPVFRYYTWCGAHSNLIYSVSVPDPNKEGGNSAIFKMVPNGPGNRTGTALSQLNYITTSLRDVVNPRVTSAAPGSQWRDITDFTWTASGHDDHIGMDRLEIWSGGVRRSNNPYYACNGSGFCALDQTRTITWPNVPEGSTAAQILAFDGHGNWEQQNFTLTVDRSNPTLALSGALSDARGTTTMAQSLSLHAVAADARSGAKRIDIYVDGNLAAPQGDQGCPGGGCSFSRDWTFQGESYGPGEHTIRVVATDHINRSIEESFKVVWVPCP